MGKSDEAPEEQRPRTSFFESLYPGHGHMGSSPPMKSPHSAPDRLWLCLASSLVSLSNKGPKLPLKTRKGSCFQGKADFSTTVATLKPGKITPASRLQGVSTDLYYQKEAGFLMKFF